MPSPELFALNAADVVALKDLIRAFRRGDLGRPSGGITPSVQRDFVFGTLDGTINPTTVLAGPLKSGTLSVYTFTSTGAATDTTENVTVWNAAKMQCKTSRWTLAERLTANGRYVITFQAASTTGCT